LPKRVVTTAGKDLCNYWYRILGCFRNFINIFKNIWVFMVLRISGFQQHRKN